MIKNMVFVNIVNDLKDRLVKDKRFLVHEFKGNFEPFLSRLGNQSDKLFPVRWENLHGHTSLYFQSFKKKKKRQETKSRNDWNVAGYNKKTFIRWQLMVKYLNGPTYIRKRAVRVERSEKTRL